MKNLCCVYHALRVSEIREAGWFRVTENEAASCQNRDNPTISSRDSFFTTFHAWPGGPLPKRNLL